MTGKQFILSHHCQSLLKRFWIDNLKSKIVNLKYFGRWFTFSTLMLGTTLLCLTVSPALANLSHINLSTSQANIQNPESKIEAGKVLYETGRFAQAVQLLQQAVQEYQQQGDTLRLAATLSDLSLANQQLGAWTEAKQAIAQSLSLLGYQQQRRRREGATPHSSLPTLQILAQSLDIQGRLQLVMGQTEEALVTWEQTAAIYSRVNDQNGVVRSRINQAQALLASGFYRRAEAILKDVNQTLQSQPDSIEKATALRSLGDVLQLVGELENSDKVLQQSLEIAQRLQSPTDIGATLFSMGNNARTQQEKQQAITYYQQTVKTSPSLLLKVQAQLNQLSLLIEDKHPTDAQALLPLIQSQLDQLPPSRSAVYARINFAQSLLKVRSEELGVRNSELLTLAAQILATAVQQARSLSDKRAEAYALGFLGGLYEQTGQWTEAQNLTQQALFLAQASNAPEIAYRWQWQLGRLLKAQKDFKGAITAYNVAVDTLQSLRSDLVAVNQDVQFTFRDSVEPVYRQSVELLLQSQQGQPNEKTLEKARQQIEALQLAELDNFFRQACLQSQKVLLDQVVDHDNPAAAIFYPIILANELQVIVKIPRQPLRLHRTRVTQVEIEKTVAQMRQNLVKPYAIKALKAESQQVYNWLIKPIESQLQHSEVNTLVFVLDGALRNLPPSVLYDGKQYLVEKYAIALSVGLQLFNPKPLVRQQLRALTAGLTQPPPFSNFAPLPAIKTELKLITEAGVSTTTLLDQQFTKSALESEVNTIPFNIVHLATHGEFSSRARDTFILAADGPIYVSDFDNILRNQDETRSQAVQLLVLSACQTAAGDNRAALGLAGAAIRAGARSTIASLWQIDDESTAMFVGAFYRELRKANVSKSEALRRAQLQLLKHPNYNAPSFWSAYVLIGNWL